MHPHVDVDWQVLHGDKLNDIVTGVIGNIVTKDRASAVITSSLYSVN